MTPLPPAPSWMKTVLLAAAAYNIAWGGFAVILPHAMFDLMGMERPNYPEFWQCIGMIVGVYGVGYAIAAFDPMRHWPIVAVGFLGKVFGPLGMVQALWTGSLPWVFAINCLFNDVIWWVPFGLILWRASEQYQAEPGAGAPLDEDKLLREARTTTGATVAALSEDRPVLLVFLRHAGCTFCREAMADLAERRVTIEARGTTVVLVHMGAAAEFARFAGEYGLDDLPAVSDPERQLYRALGLRRGRWSQLLGPTVWWRGFQAWKSGHAVGTPAGDVMQMPGTFLISHGRVIRRFLHATASDRPDYAGLCELPASI